MNDDERQALLLVIRTLSDLNISLQGRILGGLDEANRIGTNLQRAEALLRHGESGD